MKYWLKLIIAAALFAVLFRLVEWRESMNLLAAAASGPTIAAIVMSVSGLLLSAYRWNVLLRAHSVWISHYESIRLYWIGSFFSNYMPSNIGGDVVRAAMANQPGKLAPVAASIVVERITGLFVLLLLAALALGLRPQYFEAEGLLPLLWIAVGAALAGIIVTALSSRRLAALVELAAQRVTAAFAQKLVSKFGKLIDAVNHYKDYGLTVASTLLLALVFYGTAIIFQYSVIAAVGGELPLREVMLVAPLIPLVSVIPISLNALGLAEGAFVLFYTQAGLSPAEALAAALLRRLVLLLVSMTGGVFWLSGRERGKHEKI